MFELLYPSWLKAILSVPLSDLTSGDVDKIVKFGTDMLKQREPVVGEAIGGLIADFGHRTVKETLDSQEFSDRLNSLAAKTQETAQAISAERSEGYFMCPKCDLDFVVPMSAVYHSAAGNMAVRCSHCQHLFEEK